MTTLSTTGFSASPGASQPDTGRTPPPLRLPRFLLQHLARPLNTAEDVDELMAYIKQAEHRGLL